MPSNTLTTDYSKILHQLCPEHSIKKQVQNSLDEDLAGEDDKTASLIAKDCMVKQATVTTNQAMVVCGIAWVNMAFSLCDAAIKLTWMVSDGDYVVPGTVLCSITGNARATLTAERVALNFLQTLSGTATTVRQYVTAVAAATNLDTASGSQVKIMDTRKTIPGLRLAQKYAVRVGGGYNQRLGLYDGVLIKENHIAACGGVANAFVTATSHTAVNIPIQIEVETFDELITALDAGAKNILLDNMSLSTIKRCVNYTNGRAELEVSGGVNLTNITQYVSTGVQKISIGSLTKNLQAIDLSLRIVT